MSGRADGFGGIPVVALATAGVLGLCALLLALHGTGPEGVRACIRLT